MSSTAVTRYNLTNLLNLYALRINPNPIIMNWLSKTQPEFCRRMLSSDPNFIEWLEEDMNRIDWEMLSANPHPKAIEWLKKNPDKIYWSYLSGNPNPTAVEWLFVANPTKICWSILCTNTNVKALELLSDNLQYVNLIMLKTNSSPKAKLIAEQYKTTVFNQCEKLKEECLEKTLKKKTEDMGFVDWVQLNYCCMISGKHSRHAFDVLKQNYHRINWFNMSCNPLIIEL